MFVCGTTSSIARSALSVLGLIRHPSFATSRRRVLWNIMGIVDLVVAISLGTICSGFVPGINGTVTTGPMAQLPLVLIPAYLVPIFITLHCAALAQVRQLARSGNSAPTPNILTHALRCIQP